MKILSNLQQKSFFLSWAFTQKLTPYHISMFLSTRYPASMLRIQLNNVGYRVASASEFSCRKTRNANGTKHADRAKSIQAKCLYICEKAHILWSLSFSRRLSFFFGNALHLKIERLRYPNDWKSKKRKIKNKKNSICRENEAVEQSRKRACWDTLWIFFFF